jgi:hypothetical protein
MPNNLDRESSTKKISNLLAAFSSRIKLSNSVNEGSINVLAENIYLKVFNCIYDLDLQNLNYDNSNQPSIDLIDFKQRIAIQITATHSVKKIRETLNKFCKNKIYKKVDKLIFFLITEKKRVKAEKVIEEFHKSLPDGLKVKFDTQCILDYRDLYKEILKQNNSSKNDMLIEVLENELSELSKYLNTFSQTKNLLFAFSDDNYEIAKLIAEDLLSKKIHIYHSSARLEKERNLRHQNLFYTSSAVVQKAEFCLLILSDGYLRSRWISGKHCNILASAINNNLIILPYAKNLTLTVPTSIRSHLTNKVSELNYQNYAATTNEIANRLDIINLNGEFNNQSEFENILRLSDPLSEITLIEENSKLGFTIFQRTSQFSNQKIFFIFFQPSVKTSLSFEYITTKYGIDGIKSCWILLLKEKNQKIQYAKIDSIRSIFQPYQILYLESFIWRFCTSDSFREATPKFDINYYIEPYLRDEFGQDIASSYLLDWINTANQPVLALTGSGGIGKTTLARTIANKFIDVNPNSKVIFVDSRQIIKILRNKWNPVNKIDLYSFYDALLEEANAVHNRLELKKFIINMDYGNILMIVDGLDEVMANIPQFDANDFFSSINTYNPSIGKGKVVITCRNYFWNNSVIENSNNISCIEILPFDEILARRYFTIRHENSLNRVLKCMNYAASLTYHDEENQVAEYLPFVLEIIDQWVEASLAEESEEDATFNSKYLNQSNNSDYILYRICAREKIRIQQMEVDRQIQFFIEFSVKNITPGNHSNPTAKMLEEDFDNLIHNIFPNITDSEVLSLKGHAFIDITDSVVSFKYDFLADYFKNIYASQFLDIEGPPVDYRLIMILANHAKYYSAFVKDIYMRKNRPLNDDFIYRLCEINEQIINYNEHKVEPLNIYKALSGLFSIALLIKNKAQKTNAINNTEILLDIFSSDNKTVKNLAIIDLISFDGTNKVLFDFSDLTFQNCYFNNYAYFWDCKSNPKTTKFIKSHFKNLNSDDDLKTTSLTWLNFPDCDYDETLSRVLDNLSSKHKSSNELIIGDLQSFLNLFLVQGRLAPRSIAHVIELKYKSKSVSLSEMILFLNKHGVIDETKETGENNRIFIMEKFRPDIYNFITQGTTTSLLNKIIRALIQHKSN